MAAGGTDYTNGGRVNLWGMTQDQRDQLNRPIQWNGQAPTTPSQMVWDSAAGGWQFIPAVYGGSLSQAGSPSASPMPSQSSSQVAAAQPPQTQPAGQQAPYSAPMASQNQINSLLQQRFAYAAANPPTAPTPATPAATPPAATQPASTAVNQGINPITGKPLLLPGAVGQTASATQAASNPNYNPMTMPPRAQSGFWANYFNNGSGYGQRVPTGVFRSSAGGIGAAGGSAFQSNVGAMRMTPPAPAPQPNQTTGLNYPASLGLGNFYSPYKTGQAQTMNTGAPNRNFLGSYAPRY